MQHTSYERCSSVNQTMWLVVSKQNKLCVSVPLALLHTHEWQYGPALLQLTLAMNTQATLPPP